MAGFGLRIAKSQGMEGYSGNTSNFPLSTSNTNPIFVGDPVVLNGGYCEAATVVANPILGVFLGWEDTGVEAPYGSKGQPFNRNWTAADGARSNSPMAKVAIPPHGMFWVKGEAGVDFQPATSIGAAHPFVINAGDAFYGDSRWTLGAPAAGPCVVHRLVDMPGNAWGTGEPILEVTVNLQQGTFADAS